MDEYEIKRMIDMAVNNAVVNLTVEIEALRRELSELTAHVANLGSGFQL